MCAGLGFLAFELLLTHGPPTAWLKSGFKANPKLRLDQIDEAIRQAKSRLVGSLHLLIQVRSYVHPISPSPGRHRQQDILLYKRTVNRHIVSVQIAI